MKKEYRIKIKELEKELSVLKKRKAKEYGFKKIDSYLWSYNKEMFYYADIDVWLDEKNLECKCSYKWLCKPMWIDELLWVILNMEENKSAPLSLRCTGAFTFNGIESKSQTTLIDEFSPEKLELCVDSYINDFKEKVQNFSILDFYENVNEDIYQYDIYNLLYLVYQKKYSEAYKCAEGMIHSGFINKGKKLSDYAKEYCLKMIK